MSQSSKHYAGARYRAVHTAGMVNAKITAAQPSRSGPPLPLLLSIASPT